MIIALLVVVGVELIWVPWSEYVNLAHGNMSSATSEAAAIANALYFYGMFVSAALLDFLAVQILINTLKNNSFTLYQLVLIGLFCVSIVSHSIGMTGFFADWTLAMQVYDSMGMGILALEAAVFIGYGLDRLLIGDRYSNFSSSKGRD